MEPSKGKSQATIGLVMGIIGLVFALFLSWIPFVSIIGIALSIVGILFSAKGGKLLREEGQPNGMATAGLVLSIVALVFASIFFLTCTVCTGCAVCGAQKATNDLEDILSQLR